MVCWARSAGTPQRAALSRLAPDTTVDANRILCVDGPVITAGAAFAQPDVMLYLLRHAGFRVYLPSLFGVDGAYPTADAGLQVLRRACMSAEFHALAGQGASPVTAWLRALARRAMADCGGPGVGAIGMRHFGPQQRLATLDSIEAGLRPYVTEAFVNDGQNWVAFDAAKLLADPRFLQASQ